MADPLSVTAAVVGLITFTSTVLTGLSGLASTIKSASGDLQATSQQVSSVRHALLRLRVALDRSYGHGNEALDDFLVDEENTAQSHLEHVLGDCKTTLEKIQAKVAEVRSAKDGNGFERVKHVVLWTGVRKELGDLRTRLECHKTAILLWLNIRSLEMLNAAAERCGEMETRFVELSKQLQGWKDQHSRDGFSEVIDVPLRVLLDKEVVQTDLVHGYSGFDEIDGFYQTPDVYHPNQRYSQVEHPTQFGTKTTAIFQYGHQRSSSRESQSSEGQGSSRDSSSHLQSRSVVETHSSIGSWLSTFGALNNHAENPRQGRQESLF